MKRATKSRSRRSPRSPYPLHSEASYRYRLLRRLRALERLVLSGLLPALAEDPPDGERMDGVVDVRAELGIIARLWAMTATLRDMKSIAIGAAAFASRKAVPADKRTPGTSAEVEPWFRTNVGLIQSMEQETLKEIDTLIVEGFEEGMSTDAIASEMRRRFGVAKSRARFIARNEIGNLNAAVNKERQQQAGGRRYYWRTSKDERVRPLHAAREGQVFDWDNPPEGGHAGEDHNCRCYPEYIPED